MSYSVYNQHKEMLKLLKTLFSKMHTSAGWIWQQKQWFVITSHNSNQESSILDHLIIRTFSLIISYLLIILRRKNLKCLKKEAPVSVSGVGNIHYQEAGAIFDIRKHFSKKFILGNIWLQCEWWKRKIWKEKMFYFDEY